MQSAGVKGGTEDEPTSYAKNFCFLQFTDDEMLKSMEGDVEKLEAWVSEFEKHCPPPRRGMKGEENPPP